MLALIRLLDSQKRSAHELRTTIALSKLTTRLSNRVDNPSMISPTSCFTLSLQTIQRCPTGQSTVKGTGGCRCKPIGTGSCCCKPIANARSQILQCVRLQQQKLGSPIRTNEKTSPPTSSKHPHCSRYAQVDRTFFALLAIHSMQQVTTKVTLKLVKVCRSSDEQQYAL